MAALCALALCAVNIFFVMLGLVMVLIGSLALAMESLFVDLLEGQVTSPSVAVITVGVITFATALLGCFATLRESTGMIKKYCKALGALVAIKVIIGLVAFLYVSTFKEGFVHKYTADFNLYFNHSAAREVIDTNQEAWECCGLEGPADWYRPGEVHWLPASCCQDPTAALPLCGYRFWTGGCLTKHTARIQRWLHSLAWTSIAFAAFEVVGVVLGVILVKKIEKEKEEWEESSFMKEDM